jgi:hypothetical protein
MNSNKVNEWKGKFFKNFLPYSAYYISSTENTNRQYFEYSPFNPTQYYFLLLPKIIKTAITKENSKIAVIGFLTDKGKHSSFVQFGYPEGNPPNFRISPLSVKPLSAFHLAFFLLFAVSIRFLPTKKGNNLFRSIEKTTKHWSAHTSSV